MVDATKKTIRKPDSAKVFDGEIIVAGLDDALAHIEEFGYAVFPQWLSKERVARLGSDLLHDVHPIRELMPPERKTVRAHNLLGKTRCVDDLVCDPRLVAVVQGMLGSNVQVSVVAYFDLLPGAKAQGLHQDDGLWPIPRPHPPFVANAVVAIDDFTVENGATTLVPESHKWHDTPVRQPPDVETVQVEMEAGTMLIWTGALWHGGGENRSNRSRRAIDINFNLSYLRQQENQFIGIPRDQLPKMPDRLRKLVGYQHGLSFVGPGMVDLRDPLQMLEAVEFGYNVNDERFPPIG